MSGKTVAAGFGMKTCIHDKGVIEAVKKSNPPPAPPPAGDRMDLTRTGIQNEFNPNGEQDGFDTNKGLAGFKG